MIVAHNEPKPTATSALRLARAEAVADLLAQEGRTTYLATLRARMRYRGLTSAQTDRAIDDLADAKRVTITISADGGLVVRLGGAA